MGRFDSLLQMESNAAESSSTVGMDIDNSKNEHTSKPKNRYKQVPVHPTPPKQTNKLSHEQARYHASTIANIRRIVLRQGQQVSFTRLTQEEKQTLAEIVFAYKQKGIRTSENEINRIAINYLLADYQARGEESLLALVLAALYA